MLDEVVTTTTQEAVATALRLAREEGIFAGISSGAAVAAAVKVSPLTILFQETQGHTHSSPLHT